MAAQRGCDASSPADAKEAGGGDWLWPGHHRCHGRCRGCGGGVGHLGDRDQSGRGCGACGVWPGRCPVDRSAASGSCLGAPRMITVPAGTRILLATRPVDFRKGAHGLAALAQEVLAEDPFSGAVIVYRSKRADRVKLLVWDHSGLVLVWKQLQQGSFRWPPIKDGVMTLSPVAFAALFDGLDWTRVQTIKAIPKPSVAA